MRKIQNLQPRFIASSRFQLHPLAHLKHHDLEKEKRRKKNAKTKSKRSDESPPFHFLVLRQTPLSMCLFRLSCRSVVYPQCSHLRSVTGDKFASVGFLAAHGPWWDRMWRSRSFFWG